MAINKNSTRYFSNRQEKNISKTLNVKIQSNSGATQFCKGDLITDRILIEAKTSTSDKKSYSIKKSDLEKLDSERFSMRKEFGVLAFNFGPSCNENWYVINEKAMKFIKDCLDKEE